MGRRDRDRRRDPAVVTRPSWHEAVRETVAALACSDARTAAARRRILSDLERLPRPFDVRADRTHVTASAIVSGPRGVLLHRHKRLGLWLQPGGHLDEGEPPWEAAVRETVEETGLRPADPASGEPPLVHVDVHEAALGHVHLDLRYLLHADGVPCPPTGESQLVHWFAWREALSLVDESLRTALRICAPRAGPRGQAGE